MCILKYNQWYELVVMIKDIDCNNIYNAENLEQSKYSNNMKLVTYIIVYPSHKFSVQPLKITSEKMFHHMEKWSQHAKW